MIRLSLKRKTLIAGAAGICFAVPTVLSTVPHFGLNCARAEETPAVRNPNHLLQAAVDRELSGLGIEHQQDPAQIQLTAGEQPYPPQSAASGQPGFNQQQYQSQVQQQLQQLYQQDGRPMPNMVTTPAVPTEAWEQYIQQHGELPTSGRRRGRWDWLKPQTWRRQWQRTFGQSDQTAQQPPVAPEFNPELNEAQPLPQSQPQTPPTVTATHPLDRGAPRIQVRPAETPQPPLAPAAQPVAQSANPQPRLLPGLLEEMQQPVEQPVEQQVEQPAAQPQMLILLPAEPEGGLTEPVAAPPIEERPFAANEPARPEPQFESPLAGQGLPLLENAVREAPPQTPASGDPLLNPFPELAEDAADGQTGPYSGLELELDPFANPAPSTTSETSSQDENPFAPYVERRAEATVNVQPRLPAIDEVGPALQGPGLSTQPAAMPSIEPRQLPATTASNSASNDSAASNQSPEVRNKLQRIASRSGLTGLKGFCPVVLRDYRDLEDARAEFTVIYDGKQYWFSSEEAKQTFLLAPDAYAPVGGGIDLVHFQNTGEEREGLLDHAAWFQGRLHLFTSAENKATFVASPRTFSNGE